MPPRQVLGCAVVVVVLAAGGSYAWRQWRQAHHAAWQEQQLSLHRAMDQDTLQGYRQVVQRGQAWLADGGDPEGVGPMVGYAAAILAIEHQDRAMLALARRLLASQSANERVTGLEGQEGYGSAARILMLYGDGDLTEGLALAESVSGVEPGFVMAKLEGLRLMVAAKVEMPKVTVLAQELGESVSTEVRALNYLGMWQLSLGNTAQAEQYFSRVLGHSPTHPLALLGLQWVRLSALHPAAEDLWRAHKQACDLLRLPATALTPPVAATALLVRALALELEGDAPRAERDRAEALQLDPGNLLHEIRPEGPARP
jgi:tetratricopeptide (TPR) repeat protein